MIALGVFVCVVFICLFYEYLLERNPKVRIFVLIAQTVTATVAFYLGWDIWWIRVLCGIETVIEVLNIISVVDIERFPFHVVPVARTLYITAVLAASIDHNTAACVLFSFTCLLNMLDIVICSPSLHLPLTK